jgi:hypothetical protein
MKKYTVIGVVALILAASVTSDRAQNVQIGTGVTVGSAAFPAGSILTNPLMNMNSALTASQGTGQYLTGSALSAGNLYYFAAGGLTAAKADVATTLPAICLAISTTQCVFSGVFKFSASQSWTAGNILYVSDTSAGAIVTTAPSTSGHFVQRVGVALANDTALVMPSLDVGGLQ